MDVTTKATILGGVVVAIFALVLQTIAQDAHDARVMLVNMHLRGIVERHRIQCELGLPISDIEEVQ